MRKMRQRAKYAVIAYSHKTDMPIRHKARVCRTDSRTDGRTDG